MLERQRDRKRERQRYIERKIENKRDNERAMESIPTDVADSNVFSTATHKSCNEPYNYEVRIPHTQSP